MAAAPPPRPDRAAVARWLRRAAAAPAPWLHAEVARRMAERLALIRKTPATVIDWWGHAGGSGDALAKAYPKARRLIVEPTPALVARSRADAARPWWSPQRWAAPAPDVRDEADVAPASGELLWANLMLTAAADVPALLARWRSALAVDGFLMFSCYGPDTLAELRARYRARGWGPPALPWADMHDIGDALVHAGFADPVMDQEHVVLSWDGVDALLDELRTLGVNSHPARHGALRTPRWRDALARELERALRGPDGRLQLTFEIVYGHAFNPAPRPRVAAQTEVPLDAMRAMVRSRGGSGSPSGERS